MKPLEFLQRHHRRRIWRFPLWIGVAGLLAVFVVTSGLHRRLFAEAPPPIVLTIWATGVGATLFAVVAAFLFGRHSLTETAQSSDNVLQSQNRLEALAQLAGTRHPLAKAQYVETSDWLSRRLPPAAHAGIVPGAVLLTLLLLLHLLLAGVWTVGSRSVPKPENKPVAASNLPHAEFRWKSPKPEIKATKIEEVPLVAEVESTSGLKNVTLEIDVNGVPKKSVLIPAAPFHQKGTHPLNASIYLDELEVEPFDMVSYYLRGERTFSEKLPTTISEMQFVQIRPFREDAVELGKGLGASLDECWAILKKLKIAQLRSLKENFILAGTELPKTDDLWKAENKRVGDDQSLLTSKVDEAIPVMIEGGVSAEIINLLMQAKPHMESAAKLIAATDNVKAAPEQSKSLALITQCEKLFVKAFGQGQGKPTVKPKDPFADNQKFKLKPRDQTAAGNLEKLAKDQAKLNSEINAAGSGESPPDAAERQKQISRALGEAGNSGRFDEKTTEELAQAREAAQEAAGQLDAADPEAAKEPAARTLQHLQAAIDQINKAGKQSASEALADAQKQLNDAANQMKGSDGDTPEAAQKAKEKAAQAGAGMIAEAERQQENGSAAGAGALAEMVKKLQDSRAGQELAQRAQGSQVAAAAKLGDKLEALAKAAAGQQTKLASGKEALAEILDDLRRAQANVTHLAGMRSGDAKATEEILSEIQAVTQRADVLRPENDGIGERVVGELRTIRNKQSAQVAVDLTPLQPLLEEWIQLLAKQATAAERDEIVSLSRPEEAPAVYRESVADYFERLSKDYEKAKPEDAR